MRLVPMPVLCWLLYEGRWWPALIVGVLIGCTDFIDGYLARKHGPTVLGGLMDPIADKVFIAFVYMPFADPRMGLFAPWAVALLFTREFLVTALRSSYERRGLRMKTSYLGKVKTWTQMQGIGTAVLFVMLQQHRAVMWAILLSATLAPLVAFGILWIVRKRPWKGALVMTGSNIPLVLLHAFADVQTTVELLLYGVVAITWISGIDYLFVGLKQLRGRGDIDRTDVARLTGAIALPALLFAVLANTSASPWPLVTILAVEVAVGGLDNLLSHHRAHTSATLWAARVLGGSALLVAALLAPDEYVNFFVGGAAFVAVIGVAWEFWRGSDYYVDSRLRDKPQREDSSPRLPKPTSLNSDLSPS